MSILNEVYLQLFTLQSLVEQSFEKAVAAAAGIGYKGVEFSPSFDTPAAEYKRIIDKYGMKVSGFHLSPDAMIGQADQVIELAKTVGCGYVFCAYAEMADEAQAIGLAERMNSVVEKYTAYGIIPGYHNHAHEFEKSGDRYLYDIFFENLDSRFASELDTYWITYAGVDLFAVMDKYAGRTPVIHLKDMEKDGRGMADVGAGVVDFPKIVEKAKQNGVKIFVVEKDCSDERSAMASFEYLTK